MKRTRNPHYSVIPETSPRKFVATDESDYDRAIATRSFSGRLTKGRYKAIASYCRKNSFRSRCSHEYDCCGCMYAQNLSFEYKHNQVTVTLIQHHNY
jgi:hypothetical protein